MNFFEIPVGSRQEGIKYFYECGGCDNYHPIGFTGDCRDDANRYNFDDEDNLVNPMGEGYRLYTYEIVDEDCPLEWSTEKHG